MTNQSRPRGRPSASSRAQIERHAIDLFERHGFSRTTIPMIAEAAGVSRTTFFRYYRSKAEIIWAPFEAHTQHLQQLLAAQPATSPIMEGVRECVIDAFRHSIDSHGVWIQRFRILDSSTELRSEESAHWLSWAEAVAAHVARRTGSDIRTVAPQAVGGAVQAAFLTTLRTETMRAPVDEVTVRIDDALRPLCDVLQRWLDTP